MTKYTTILFDADETLLDFIAAEASAIQKVCARFNIPFSEEVRRTYSEINAGLWKQLEKGLVTRDEIKIRRFETFAETVGTNAEPAALAKEYISALSSCGDLLEGAEELCKSFSERFDLYIVTNGIASVQKSRLALSGLLPYFKGCFISEEMGSAKPKKEFFEQVFQIIPEKDKSKICIVGDSLSSDIAGGINAGIDTCHFCPDGVPENEPATFTAESFDELRRIFF